MDIQRSAEGSSDTRGKKKKRASVSLTHWLQTLWSRCRLLWRRIRSVSSAEKEPCRDRRHPHLSPSSWSPHSEEMRYRFIVTWLEQDTSPNGTVHYLPSGILLETLSYMNIALIFSAKAKYQVFFNLFFLSVYFKPCLCALFRLTCEMALKALVLPIFSPPLETDSAECMADLAASSTPSLIFLPISVRLTSSRPCGHVYKSNALSTVGCKECR